MPTCNDQARCINIEITPASAANAPCSEPACRQYQACFWWSTGGSCPKTGTISHTCPKPGCQGDQEDFNGVTGREFYPAGEKQCKFGPAGSSLYFLMKDASDCSAGATSYTWQDYFGSDITPGSSPVTIVGSTNPQDVECTPRPSSIQSCTGNGVGVECVWRVDLPTADTCVSEEPSPSERDRLVSKTSAVENPSPNPSPEDSGPSEQNTCCPVDGPCNKDLSEEQAIQDVLGNEPYFTATLPNCPDEAALVQLRECCGCEKDPVCNLIICTDEVPEEVLTGPGGIGAEAC